MPKFEMIKEKKIKKKLGDIFTFLLSLWHSHISGFEFIGRIYVKSLIMIY